MNPVILIGAWFACGALGAWIARRRYFREFGNVDGTIPASLLTTVLGPIGLMGVLMFLLLDRD